MSDHQCYAMLPASPHASPSSSPTPRSRNARPTPPIIQMQPPKTKPGARPHRRRCPSRIQLRRLPAYSRRRRGRDRHRRGGRLAVQRIASRPPEAGVLDRCRCFGGIGRVELLPSSKSGRKLSMLDPLRSIHSEVRAHHEIAKLLPKQAKVDEGVNLPGGPTIRATIPPSVERQRSEDSQFRHG